MRSIKFLILGLLGVSSLASAVDVAKVNGRAITDKDLRGALSSLNETQRESWLKDSANRKQLVARMIDQEILAQEGEKEKLDQDQDFKESVAAFRRQYLMSKVLQKNITGKLTEGAARKYYDVHRQNYSTDSVHVQQILVSDETEAKDLMKKAKDSGTDFQELAEKYSKDSTVKNNRGDLGYLSRLSQYVPEFLDAAFSGQAGQVVGPVKTAFGYHIIKVIDRRMGKYMNYDEVELQVKQALREELAREYLGKLKEQAKVTVDSKAVNRF